MKDESRTETTRAAALGGNDDGRGDTAPPDDLEELKAFLAELDLPEAEQLAALDEMRSHLHPGALHLTAQELADLDRMPAARLKHLDECRVCQGLISALFHPRHMTQLVQAAAQSARNAEGARRRKTRKHNVNRATTAAAEESDTTPVLALSYRNEPL